MKTLILYLLVVLVLNENVSGLHSASSNSIRFTPEAVIHQLSELVRYLIRSGDASNGVPILDPYEFQRGQFDLKGKMLNANINITSGNLTGLGNFILQGFNFSRSEIAIESEIYIPSLKLYSDYYELAGNIYNALPIKGQGIVDIEVHNITLWGKLYLKQSENCNAILVDKIEDPRYRIERIVSRTQFDNNIDGIISMMVEDLLADYLTRFSKHIAATYSDNLVQFLNPILNKFETWNLIAVILTDMNLL